MRAFNLLPKDDPREGAARRANPAKLILAVVALVALAGMGAYFLLLNTSVAGKTATRDELKTKLAAANRPGRAAAAGRGGRPGPGRGEGEAHGSPLVGPRWPDRVGSPAPGVLARPPRRHLSHQADCKRRGDRSGRFRSRRAPPRRRARSRSRATRRRRRASHSSSRASRCSPSSAPSSSSRAWTPTSRARWLSSS